MPRHPLQPNKSARHNQKEPTSTQNPLKTTNHTGWQSRPSTYTEETTNFVITRHSTDNYTIKPKELERRPEVNNIKPVCQNNTMPELPNDDEQPSLPKPNNVPKKPKYEIRQHSATLQLNKKDMMLYVPLHFRAYENFGLIDTGAIQSALSEAELRRILSAHPGALLQELPAPEFKVQTANGNIETVRKQVLLRFFIGGKVFEETFMVLPTMGNVFIEMSFFKKYSVTLDLANNIVKFPDITLQLRSVNGKIKNKLLELKTTQKIVIQHNQQVFVPVVIERDLGDITGSVEGLPAFERRSHLIVSPALSETQEGRTHVQITNPLDYQITINMDTALASFKIMTPKQAKILQPMTGHQLNLISRYPDEAEAVLNQIFQDPRSDRRWYPTPEISDDPSKLNKIERRI